MNSASRIYSVPGVSCEHCRAAITREVSAVAGVESVEVDLDRKVVVVGGAGRATPRSGRRSTRPAYDVDDARDGARCVTLARLAGPMMTLARTRADRAADRGHDVRLLRGRIERKLNKLDGVERVGQLRDREGRGRLRPGEVAPDDARRRGRGRPATRARAAATPRPSAAGASDPTGEPAAAPRRLGRPLAAGAADGDDPGAPVRLLAVAGARARDARRALGRLAVPPSPRWTNLRHGAATMDTLISLGTLAAWGWSVVALFFLDAGDAGHEDAVRADAVARRRRASRSTSRSPSVVVDVPPRRPLLRGAREAPRRRRAARAARARRQGRRRARRGRHRAARADRRSSRSATASSCGRARRSRPTASSTRAARRSTSRC